MFAGWDGNISLIEYALFTSWSLDVFRVWVLLASMSLTLRWDVATG